MNFLNAALDRSRRIASGAGNLAYNYLGGRQFADANRKSNKIMAEGGSVLDVLKSPDYWSSIALGTANASTLAGGPGLIKGGLSKIAGAVLRKPPKVPVKLPPAVAPNRPPVAPSRDIFSQPAGYIDDSYAARSASQQGQVEAARQAEAQFRQQQINNAYARVQSNLNPSRPPRIKPDRVIKNTIITAATGAAASQGKPAKTQAQIEYEKIGKNTKKNKGGKK